MHLTDILCSLGRELVGEAVQIDCHSVLHEASSLFLSLRRVIRLSEKIYDKSQSCC